MTEPLEMDFSFKQVMQHSINVIETYGFYSIDDALINDTEPTAKRIYDSLNSDTNFDNDNDIIEKTDFVIDWLKDINKSGDSKLILYGRNKLNHGVTHYNQLGGISALLNPYGVYCSNYAKLKRVTDTEFIDEHFKLRHSIFNVTGNYVTSLQTEFPNTLHHIFKTEDNYKLLWSSGKRLRLKRNTKYKLKGTVKTHDMNHEQKTTKVLRLKINEIKA